jgi:hypothetical protein
LFFDTHTLTCVSIIVGSRGSKDAIFFVDASDDDLLMLKNTTERLLFCLSNIQ